MIKAWSYTEEYKSLRKKILRSVDKTLKSGQIFFGKELDKFEKRFIKENNLKYVFSAILTSVLIFYFNDFSAALGKTEKLPIGVSVWMPIVIIFIFGAVGLIHANQK